RLTPGRPERQPDGANRGRLPLWPAAHLLRLGPRLPLPGLTAGAPTPLRHPLSRGARPRYARNPGTGDPLGTATALVPAQQQVFHDPGHLSALILPVPL